MSTTLETDCQFSKWSITPFAYNIANVNIEGATNYDNGRLVVNSNNYGFRKSIALNVAAKGYANFAAPITIVVTVCGAETYTYNNVTSYTVPTSPNSK